MRLSFTAKVVGIFYTCLPRSLFISSYFRSFTICLNLATQNIMYLPKRFVFSFSRSYLSSNFFSLSFLYLDNTAFLSHGILFIRKHTLTYTHTHAGVHSIACLYCILCTLLIQFGYFPSYLIARRGVRPLSDCVLASSVSMSICTFFYLL
jgi:hypothetical protein